MSRSMALLVAATALAAAPLRAQSQAGLSTYEQLQVFSGVLSQIRVNYVDSVNTGTLVRAAIEGMLASLDPHSRFERRRDFELYQAYESGTLAGAGMWLEDVDGSIVVLAVEPEGPADRAGIRPGDRLRSLNEQPTAGTSAAAAAVLLLGEKGTRIRLSLERGSRLDPETLAVTVRRSVVDPRVVSGPHLAAGGIAYVRLMQFTSLAPERLREAIKGMPKLRADRLILDLRGNPGGHMGALGEIAGSFLPANVELFHADGRTRAVRDTLMNAERGEFADLPLIVLIDEASASAAEILAGALQDHDRALLVGRRSFGKALMQTALPLPGGDIVWLTTGRIVLPSGRVVQRPYAGVNLAQYREGAGQAAAGDTARRYRTAGGRLVQGGGGIEPDVRREADALPAWFSVAADSGFITAIAEVVAPTLADTPEARRDWRQASERWETLLTIPFLDRLRSRLGVRADVSPALRARLGRLLARRTAEVRWGTGEAETFQVLTDPDIALAVQSFAQLDERLAGGAASTSDR